MDQLNLHLLTSHLPVFGAIIGVLVFTHLIWEKKGQTKIATFYLLTINSIRTLVTYLTRRR